jgi:uncharacterized membrane protein YphA (DoxX/SURF4 family)
MNLFLWILQFALAALFAMAGTMKLTQPREKYVAAQPWAEDFSANTLRFIGSMELLAVVGLILPAATGIAVVLTPLAALGLVVVMLLAANTHRRRNEWGKLAFTLVLAVVAAFVAWARFGPYSF